MANPYASLARGGYSETDIWEELQQSGGAQYPTMQYSQYSVPPPPAQQGYPTFPTQANAGFPMNSGQTMMPGNNPFAVGNVGFPPRGDAPDDNAPPPQQVQQVDNGFPSFQDFRPQAGTYADAASLYEGAVDFRHEERRIVGERLLEVRNQHVNSKKPIYTFEKVVEVPQVVVREVVREVPKPELIERIIEVPKTEVRERTYVAPPQVQYQEQIVEVPQVTIEETVVHVPKREIQERLIEVPKVEFVERIEYEDFVEYREVPVDRIVEVPEIEYRVREVEQFVPQTYVQEYYVDKYVEMPVTQVQEVERVEHVPVRVPQGFVPDAGAGQQGRSQYVTMSMTVPREMAEKYATMAQTWGVQPQSISMWEGAVIQSYASYDPNKVGSYASAASSTPAGVNPFASTVGPSQFQSRVY